MRIGTSYRTVVLEKTLESPLDCKEIKPVNPKEISLDILLKDWCWSWSSNALAMMQRTNSLKKTLTLGRIEGRRRMTEDEMVGWHHWFNGHKFEQAPEVGDEQGRLVCCSPWGCRVRHNWATELNWTEYHLSSDNNAAEDDIALQSELNIFKHYLKLQSKSKIRNLEIKSRYG